MKKYLILTSVSLLGLWACTPDKSAQSTDVLSHNVLVKDENQRLDLWFDDKFIEYIRRYPQSLAALGIKERMDEWNDTSYDYQLESLELIEQNLKTLKESFDFEKLDTDHQLSYTLYIRNAELEREGIKWWYHSYPFNQMYGAHSQAVSLLLNQHLIQTVQDAENYITRLNGLPNYLADVMEHARANAKNGVMPPKFVYDHVIAASRNIITGAPFDEGKYSILLEDFRKKVEALNLTDRQRRALYDKAITALLSSVEPAYLALIEEMQAQKKQATTEDGVWKLPDGDDYYAYRLALMTTTDMTAQDIHDLGLREVARIHTEMHKIMKEVEFDGDLQEFFTFMRQNPEFIYEDSEAGREAYLQDAANIIDIMETRLEDVFLRSPTAALEVKQVESYRAKSAGKAFYNRPSEDGTRPGYYYANLYKISDMPKYQMEALAYHEGVPGHHMQLSIAQELGDIPKFRRYGRFTAYSEGWGLYAEYLPKEMGFYTDPYSDFGRLAMELWRAARLVVDTGLHAKQWSRERAIKYLIENTPNPKNDCEKAIERYIVLPAQATAYKIGMIKILELREMARQALGDKFDIRGYHDVILTSGPVPLDIMEMRVKAWIAQQQAG